MNHGMYLGIDLGILRDVVNHESENGCINTQTGEKLVNCRAGDPCPMDRHHPGPVGNRQKWDIYQPLYFAMSEYIWDVLLINIYIYSYRVILHILAGLLEIIKHWNPINCWDFNRTESKPRRCDCGWNWYRDTPVSVPWQWNMEPRQF